MKLIRHRIARMLNTSGSVYPRKPLRKFDARQSYHPPRAPTPNV